MYMKFNISHLGFKPLFFLFVWSFCVGSVWGQTWENMGMSIFPGTRKISSCETGPNSDVYTGGVDNNDKGFVKKYDKQTSLWSNVNGNNFGLPSNARLFNLILKSDASNVYVLLFYDIPNVPNSCKIIVKKNTVTGWQTIGNEIALSGCGRDVYFEVSYNGVLYLMATPIEIGGSQPSSLQVLTLSYSGSSWVALPSPETFPTGNYASPQIKANTDGTLYMVYKKAHPLYNPLSDMGVMTVKKFTNGVWSSLPTLPSHQVLSYDYNINVDGQNNVFVLFNNSPTPEASGTYSNRRLKMLRYGSAWANNASGWQYMGTNGNENISETEADVSEYNSSISMNKHNGALQIIYHERCNDSGCPTVINRTVIKEYTGTQWIQIGNMINQVTTHKIVSINAYDPLNSFITYSTNDGNSYAKKLALPCPTISISPATLPDGKAGELYEQQLTQDGLTEGVSWEFVGASNGLQLLPFPNNPLGRIIKFTPSAIGTVTFTVKVSKTSLPSCSATKTYTIKVPSACASISPFVIPTAYYCTPYSITFGTSGAGITWTMTGNIPGLTLNANGVLSGTPEGISNGGQALNYSFTITRTQGDCKISKTYTLKIACPAPGVIPDPIGGGGTRGLLQQE